MSGNIHLQQMIDFEAIKADATLADWNLCQLRAKQAVEKASIHRAVAGRVSVSKNSWNYLNAHAALAQNVLGERRILASSGDEFA